MKNLLKRINTFCKNNIYFAVLPLSVLWMETVFYLSTSSGKRNLPIMIVFSLVYGMCAEWVISFIRRRSVYKFVKGICLILFALPFLVMYFIYCEFNVFYDINTVFNGAGGVAGQFGDEVSNLVFSYNGIEHVFMFLTPFIVYALSNGIRRLVRKNKASLSDKKKTSYTEKRFVIRKIKEQIVILVLISVGIILVNAGSTSKMEYDEFYNYENAIKRFGVLTAVRLDVKQSLFKSDEVSGSRYDLNSMNFAGSSETKEDVAGTEKATETVTSNETVTGENATEEITIEETTTRELTPEEYGENKLDINFKKLKKKANATLKSMDEYVESLTPSHKNKYTGLFKGKNLIFISAEAFTAEAINKKLTPTLYRLANNGIKFTDYYQPASAGTTGGEYANIFGMLPTAGGSSMKMAADNYNCLTMGSLLNEQGYYGKAYHNNDYMFYSRDITHNTLGYSDGFMGYGNGMEKYVTNQWPESDLEMFEGTIPEYIDKDKFNIYYMSVSGHNNYSFAANAMSKKNQDRVKDLDCSEPVKAYYAAQIELDLGLNYILKELYERDLLDDTVIVISADHFPYGLDGDGSGSYRYLSELYGCDISNSLVRDHNRLIIWSGCLEKMDPIEVDTPTFSPDILPTLCNLFGIDFDSRLMVGRDALSDAAPLVFTLGYEWKTQLGTYAGGVFTPNDGAEIPDNYVSVISAVVKDRIDYSKNVLEYDYYRHVFEN